MSYMQKLLDYQSKLEFLELEISSLENFTDSPTLADLLEHKLNLRTMLEDVIKDLERIIRDGYL